jgi:hypothetical protein
MTEEIPEQIEVRKYFSYYGGAGPDWEALRDEKNNPILNACLEGATIEELQRAGLSDLPERLERLERGLFIRKKDGGFETTFPAVIGAKNARMQELAIRASQQLTPLCEDMIEEVLQNLEGREYMLFHVLWSLIMDNAWGAAEEAMKKQVKTGNVSFYNQGWVIYPPQSHPSGAGTNSDMTPSGAWVRVTHSGNTPSPNEIIATVVKHEGPIRTAIQSDWVITDAQAAVGLGEYGLVANDRRLRLYALDSETDPRAAKASQRFTELGTQFAQQLVDALDISSTAEMVGCTPGVTFVIAYHQVCGELLHNLAVSGELTVPAIVSTPGVDRTESYALVSYSVPPAA